MSEKKQMPSHVCGTPDAMCDTDCMGAAGTWPMCDADSERMERAAIALEESSAQVDALVAEVVRLRERNASLAAAIGEALGYFEEREDVRDGPYGEPMPNAEMSMAQLLRAALKSSRGDL